MGAPLSWTLGHQLSCLKHLTHITASSVMYMVTILPDNTKCVHWPQQSLGWLLLHPASPCQPNCTTQTQQRTTIAVHTHARTHTHTLHNHHILGLWRRWDSVFRSWCLHNKTDTDTQFATCTRVQWTPPTIPYTYTHMARYRSSVCLTWSLSVAVDIDLLRVGKETEITLSL